MATGESGIFTTQSLSGCQKQQEKYNKLFFCMPPPSILLFCYEFAANVETIDAKFGNT